MPNASHQISADSLRSWGHRLQNVYVSLKKILAQVGADEWEWSPDEGIASIREHVLQIVKNAEAFAARYAVTTARGARGESMSDARVAIAALEKIERTVANRTADLENENSDAAVTGDASEFHDLFFAHLTYVTQKIATIQVLQQLIEPSRTPVLV